MTFRAKDEKKLLVEFVRWLVRRDTISIDDLDDLLNGSRKIEDRLIAEFLETRKVK